MGNSHGEQLSRFQLMNCVGVKTTSTTCFPDYAYGVNPIYIRFRFVSDSTIDSLSGWMIDSIAVCNTICPGKVNVIGAEHNIELYPNPAYNELNITATDMIKEVSISNIFGQRVFDRSYQADQASIDVADLPVGVYFVRINGSEVRKFVKKD